MFQMHRYTFDEVFDINTSQEEVYNCTAKPAVYSVLEGYNSTIFSYRQTGTGKTFTMEGFTYDNLDSSLGIIPRTIEDILSILKVILIEILNLLLELLIYKFIMK